MRSIHAPRSRGFVRCSGWIPANATLETSLAATGGGEADVEAQLLRDRRTPIVLGTAHLTGGAIAWTPWSVPITGLDGDGALVFRYVRRETRRDVHASQPLCFQSRVV